MKKILTLLVMFLMTGGVLMAQSFSYQAVLRDSQNHLVTGKTGTVTFKVGETVLAQNMQFFTNQNGLVSLLLENNNDVDWSNAEIKATFTFNDEQIPAIEVTTPVTAVPYALYADNVKLTTDAIVRYIDNGDTNYVTDGNDWAEIYAAMKAAPGHNALRDSVVNYIKDNKDLAVDLMLSYLKMVADTDLTEAYDIARGMDQSVKDAFYDVVKEFLTGHRSLLVSVAENFIKTATQDEMETLYKHLKTSNAALETERILKRYFNQYLIDNKYICDGTTLCDLVAMLSAMNECTAPTPEVEEGDDTKWTVTFNGNIPANTSVNVAFEYYKQGDEDEVHPYYAVETFNNVNSGTGYVVEKPQTLGKYYSGRYCIKVMMPGCQTKKFGNADVCAYAGD